MTPAGSGDPQAIETDRKSKENAMKKPYAVAKDLVCSECALPWADHREASFRECIRLLKAQPRTTIINTPVIQPLVQPYPVYPARPWWDRGWTYTVTNTANVGINPQANTSKLALNA